ncbi:uncharacterized protein [Argopecten irradians]|uniref:uncharacterized protein n=1 Tax=Argopecten irradians TaxID=31199 RepID=UPI003723EB56
MEDQRFDTQIAPSEDPALDSAIDNFVSDSLVYITKENLIREETTSTQVNDLINTSLIAVIDKTAVLMALEDCDLYTDIDSEGSWMTLPVFYLDKTTQELHQWGENLDEESEELGMSLDFPEIVDNTKASCGFRHIFNVFNRRSKCSIKWKLPCVGLACGASQVCDGDVFSNLPNSRIDIRPKKPGIFRRLFTFLGRRRKRVAPVYVT